MWRRRAALGVLGAGGLVAPAEDRPGGDLGAVLDFFRSSIPPDAGYLFVEPGAFGTDTPMGLRLRYELFPRRYDDARLAQDEATVRQLMRDEGLGFVAVPDATQYPPESWLRQSRDWLQRIELDANRYVLAVVVR